MPLIMSEQENRAWFSASTLNEIPINALPVYEQMVAEYFEHDLLDSDERYQAWAETWQFLYVFIREFYIMSGQIEPDWPDNDDKPEPEGEPPSSFDDFDFSEPEEDFS